MPSFLQSNSRMERFARHTGHVEAQEAQQQLRADDHRQRSEHDRARRGGHLPLGCRHPLDHAEDQSEQKEREAGYEIDRGHAEPAEKEKMWAAQAQILARLGLDIQVED